MAAVVRDCTSSGILLSLFFSILLPSSLALSADRKCYSGNGTITEDLPCHSGDASFCCGVGWSCLSNGLCQWRDSTSFAEGTCTDKSYPINACLGSCLASGNEDQTLVHNCGGSGAGDRNNWCCAGVQGVTGEGEDCCSTDATTTLDSFPYSTVTVIKALSKASSKSKTAAIRSSSASSSSSSFTAAFAPVTSQQALPSTSSQTSTQLPLPTQDPETANTIQQPSDSRNIAIGAGVGVPLGLLALGATTLLLYRDRRIKTQIRQLQDHMKSNNETPSQQGVEEGPKDLVISEVELETGIDRGELGAGHDSHEAPDRQLYEMV